MAVIGPTISQAAYEVGPEFVERFMDADPTTRGSSRGQGGKAQFDLPATDSPAEGGGRGGRAHGRGTALMRIRRASSPTAGACILREADYGRLISAIRV